MRSFHVLLIAVLMVVVAVGRWIAVGASEQVDQLLRDGRLEAALPLLEDRFTRGKIKSSHLLRSLAYARIASETSPRGSTYSKRTLVRTLLAPKSMPRLEIALI